MALLFLSCVDNVFSTHEAQQAHNVLKCSCVGFVRANFWCVGFVRANFSLVFLGWLTGQVFLSIFRYFFRVKIFLKS